MDPGCTSQLCPGAVPPLPGVPGVLSCLLWEFSPRGPVQPVAAAGTDPGLARDAALPQDFPLVRSCSREELECAQGNELEQGIQNYFEPSEYGLFPSWKNAGEPPVSCILCCGKVSARN